jgi:NADH-quinone oxidoreductase subunit A
LELALSILVFVAFGAVFLLANLFVGKLVRPNKPSPQKGEVYECGEKPVGTAWVQFDLRFYVVALLFVIFDVEIAFFFPWAVVFGTAAKAGQAGDHASLLLAHFAFLEFLAFFGILLLGFAYLWRRGDLEWVRAMKDREQRPPVV